MSQTYFLFLDDAEQLDCPRDGMNRLIAMGGFSIDVHDAARLSSDLEELCGLAGLPAGEPFKWSPKKNSWLQRNFTGEQKGNLFESLLQKVAEYNVSAHVMCCDPKARLLNGAKDAEQSTLLGILERFNFTLGPNDKGIVIVDRPAGDKKAEERYLGACLALTEDGGAYAKFDKLACPILTMPFPLSRPLQVADLVASITTAHVAGRPQAARFFPLIKSLFREDKGRIGGVGLKLHPDYRFANLYHWLLGDTHYVRGSMGFPMPLSDRPYREGDTQQ